MPAPMLYIYGQHQWHDPVYIVGDTDSLLRLRKAIDTAIHQGVGRDEMHPGDGEHYNVYVISSEDIHIKGLANHYTDECTGSNEGVSPQEFMNKILKNS